MDTATDTTITDKVAAAATRPSVLKTLKDMLLI
jgi:hypothetical protein